MGNNSYPWIPVVDSIFGGLIQSIVVVEYHSQTIITLKFIQVEKKSPIMNLANISSGHELEFGFPICFLAVVFLMIVGCGSPKDPKSQQDETWMKKVTVEGININYTDEGEGMPIVLVHWIPTASFLWREMIVGLTAHGRVVALDLPGFGLSDPPADGDYSISNYAGLLESFLTAVISFRRMNQKR